MRTPQMAHLFLSLFPFVLFPFFLIYLYPLLSHSGYAVTAGHFSQPTTTDVVGGAPQDGGIGKVWLFIPTIMWSDLTGQTEWYWHSSHVSEKPGDFCLQSSFRTLFEEEVR